MKSVIFIFSLLFLLFSSTVEAKDREAKDRERSRPENRKQPGRILNYQFEISDLQKDDTEFTEESSPLVFSKIVDAKAEASEVTPLNPFFEAMLGDYEYLIGRGDSIIVYVWNHPELSGPHTVGPDGKITLPLAGAVKISGLNRDAAASLLMKHFNNLFPDSQVTVSITNYLANKVLVLGSVAAPGVIRLEDEPTLIGVLTRAGGLSKDDQGHELFRNCAIIRSTTAFAWINISEILQAGRMELNIRLLPDDIVYVPDWKEAPIFVMGEVGSPRPQAVTPGLTFIQAIERSGGLRRTASRTHIRFIRRKDNIDKVINFNHVMKGQKEDFLLQPDDILYVPPNWLSRMNYFMSNFSPFSWYFFATGKSTVNPDEAAFR